MLLHKMVLTSLNDYSKHNDLNKEIKKTILCRCVQSVRCYTGDFFNKRQNMNVPKAIYDENCLQRLCQDKELICRNFTSSLGKAVQQRGKVF